MALVEILTDRWISIIGRGIIVLGSMMFLFWIWRPRWLERFRIPQLVQAPITPWREIPRTILGLSVYLATPLFVYFGSVKFGYSRMYTDIAEFGWAYFFASFFIFAVFIDTWFFWAHWLMHKVPVLKRSHAIHHRTLNVTPATSYAFDIWEALINMAPFPILVMTIPWHPLMLFIYGTWGMAVVGYVHLGFDPFYEWRQKNFFFRWFYTATHHSLHHQRYHGNYAVYFMFWDRLMGTEMKIEDYAREVKPELREVEPLFGARAKTASVLGR